LYINSKILLQIALYNGFSQIVNFGEGSGRLGVICQWYE